VEHFKFLKGSKMSAVKKQVTNAGDRVCTFGRVVIEVNGSRDVRWTGIILEAQPLDSGTLVWNRVGTYGAMRITFPLRNSKALAELKEQAQYTWVGNCSFVNQGIVCE
jgi:hypothetical protein